MEEGLALNHIIVKSLLVAKSHESSKIEPQVAADCKKEGLNCTEDNISTAVVNVLSFFSVTKHVDGVNSPVKSTNQIVKPSNKREFGSASGGVFAKFWSSVCDFDKARMYESCMIVSVSEPNLSHCVRAVAQPTLIVTSADLNEKNFSSQLGKVLLEKSCIVCFETDGLDVQGTSRLKNLLTKAKEMFDNRLHLILFCQDDIKNLKIRNFSEKHFSLKEITEPRKKSKVEKETETNDDLEKALERIGHLEKEAHEMRQKESNLRESLTVSEADLKDVKAKNQILKTDLDEAFKRRETLGDEVEVLESKLNEVSQDSELSKEELSKVSGKMKSMEMESLEMRQKNVDLRKNLSVKEAEVIDVEAKLRTVQSDLKASADLKRSEGDKHLKELKEVSEDRNVLKLELKRLDSANECLKMELTELKNEYEKGVKVISELKLKVSSEYEELKHDDDQEKFRLLEESKVEKTFSSDQTSAHPLGPLKNRIDNNRNKTQCAVDLAYISIKNLKCETLYSKADVTKCDVTITKAKHNLMKYPQLLKFAGEGVDERSAKVAAFANFLISLEMIIQA